MTDHNDKDHDHGHDHSHGEDEGMAQKFQLSARGGSTSFIALEATHRPHDPAAHSVCGCGHDHGDGHHDHHHHHHHEDTKAPSEYNNGLLKRVFSGPAAAAEVLNNARSTIALTAAGGLAMVDTSGSMPAMAAMIGATALVANEASEELMESVQYVRDKLAISGGVIGMTLSGAHLAGELALTFSSKAGEYTDLALATTMNSNVLHIPLMAGAAAAAGAVAIDKPQFRKMNLAAMITTSAALGYQVATGEYNDWLSGAGIATGIGFAAWRIKAGVSCAVHGDMCGHAHDGLKDDTDYISMSYARELAGRVKSMKPDTAFKSLKERVKTTKEKIANVKIPSREQVTTSLRSMAPVLIPSAALAVSAHIMGDNALMIAQQSGMGTTALGIIAGGALVAPELIASTKSALKGESEMAATMITGCAVLGTGIVGGVQGLLGNQVPDNLSLDTVNGMVQMGGLLVPIGMLAAATHEGVAKRLAKVDNAAAEWLERKGWIEKAGRVSNWLQNDGTKISKTAAAAMLASAMSYLAVNTVPMCHSHNGQFMHCLDPNIQQAPDPNTIRTFE